MDGIFFISQFLPNITLAQPQKSSAKYLSIQLDDMDVDWRAKCYTPVLRERQYKRNKLDKDNIR